MLITDKPEDLPSTNQLDEIDDDLLGGTVPPAYLSFGMTPCAIENPPADGDLVYFMVRARCTGEHGPVTRSDGEKRYKRDLKIQAIWLPGDPEPEEPKTQAELDAEAEAEAAKDQPPLFGDDGEPETMGDIADELLGEELADAAGVEFDGGPAFSDSDGEA
jgi:hypothetical protein